MKKIPTICPYCGCGCGIYLYVEDNRVIGVCPSRINPASRGRLCAKGWSGFEFINNPDRLKKPLVRRKGGFKEISWKDALDYISEKLSYLKKRYGPNNIGILSSAKCTNEENFLMMKFARAVLGTNNIDHCARLCHAPSVSGLLNTLGSGAMTNSMDEIKNSKVIFIIGSNTSETHPLVASRVVYAVKENNARLIIADPRNIELSKLATLQLRHNPGTDVALLNGMMNVIIKENIHDKEFIEQRTEGFDALKETVSKYEPEYCEKITGVDKNLIIEASRLFASSKNSVILYAMGITQHTTGTDNVYAISNLSLLTGNIGRESCGIAPLRGQNNVQGSSDIGALPNLFSGYQRVSDDASRQKFENAWNVKLPKEAGLTVLEMFNEAVKGNIKGMYIMGENPMLSDPDLAHVEQALSKLEFLVVQDIFLNETTEFADVVLPATSFAEKEGTFTNTERRVQLLNKAVEPLGESLPDWRIISLLSERLGYKMAYNSPKDIMKEIASLTPIYGGISYERLGSEGLQWPCPDKSHSGTRYLHKDRFSRGLGKFIAVEYKAAEENTDEKYPFHLTTGRLLYQYHTRTMTKRSTTLDREAPLGFVEVNSEDAKEIGIRHGVPVRVSTRRGSITLKVFVTDKIVRQTIFIPFHYQDAPANLLTIAALDPVSKIPEYKACAAAIEKI